MKVGVLGGTGNVGKVVVAEALKRGYEVVVLARDPAKVTDTHEHLEVVKGDAKVAEDVQRLVDATDQVVCVVGGTPTSGWVVKPAVENLLKANPKRVMVLTSLGVNGSSSTVKFLLHDVINRCIHGSQDLEEKSLFRDAEQADTLVQKATCEWVLVRPTYMEDIPGTGQYLATAAPNVGCCWMFQPVSKADAALFFVDRLEDKRWDGTPVHLHKGHSDFFDGPGVKAAASSGGNYVAMKE
mmetsp:Transcript_26637/g.80274  ORF Transcript_26637/g.80274 Transcript_26637/m.80274 type:complete len:240 (-) Transcript_26637:31-750(-)